MTPIDKYLNKYATKKMGEKFRWWWHGDDVLAAAISSAARHVRKDSCYPFSDEERRELKTLERYMKFYRKRNAPVTSVEQDMWLHAEAMWLLTRWFSRLWD